MLIPLSWLVLTSLLAPSAHAPVVFGVSSTGVASPIAVYAIIATGDSTEPALVPLTEDVASRYLAVRKEVFSIIQKDPTLVAAVKKHGQHYTFTLHGPGGMSQGQQEIVLPDFVALAAKMPVVAAVFKQHTFPPSQFAPVTIAIRKALFAEALHEAKGWAVKDPGSMAGKNIAFVAAHRQEFAGSGLGYNIQGQQGAGANDGSDLSP